MIYAIGELLIDFLSTDGINFKKNPGGAPANLLVQTKKLGIDSALIGSIGDDLFGKFLLDTLSLYQINTNYLIKTKKHQTSLAFVSLDENNDRTFSFYRNNAADLYLDYNNYKDIIFNNSDILVFGTVSLATKNNQEVYKKIIDDATKKGTIIAFDPNLRLNLFNDLNELRNICLEFMKYVDILKVSKEELEFIYQTKDLDIVINKLFKDNIKLVLLTNGPFEAKLYKKDEVAKMKPYKVNVVDTTAAGDSSFGALLYQVTKYGLSNLNLKESLSFSLKAAAVTVSNYGSISAIRGFIEIEKIC